MFHRTGSALVQWQAGTVAGAAIGAGRAAAPGGGRRVRPVAGRVRPVGRAGAAGGGGGVGAGGRGGGGGWGGGGRGGGAGELAVAGLDLGGQHLAGADAQLGEDMGQVNLDGAGRGEQPLADLAVGQAGRGQVGYLTFGGS